MRDLLLKLKLLDLFSGIGGFSYAGELSGFETVGFCEINKYCSSILKHHWPHIPNHGDIKTFNFKEYVDVITGGFPCQPFSIAGKKKGKDDQRYLWPEFLRIIMQSQPNWVIAENVAGIVAMELDNIIDDLEKENYETRAFIIPACAANAPHRRDRVWIIANRVSKRCNNGADTWESRSIQINQKWDVAALQSQWEKFQRESWKINKAKDWFEFNARISRGNDGIPAGLDRIKSLGNSIVPQVAFVFLSLIYRIESNLR